MVYQRFQGVEMDAIIGDFGSFSVWIRSIEQAQQYLGCLLVCRGGGRGSLSINKLPHGMFN